MRSILHDATLHEKSLELVYASWRNCTECPYTSATIMLDSRHCHGNADPQQDQQESGRGLARGHERSIWCACEHSQRGVGSNSGSARIMAWYSLVRRSACLSFPPILVPHVQPASIMAIMAAMEIERSPRPSAERDSFTIGDHDDAIPRHRAACLDDPKGNVACASLVDAFQGKWLLIGSFRDARWFEPVARAWP